ncbi:hypothetical protein Aconfl_16540 [Algoriphagus confluentis]|uniref:Uncharacterized protein n=1 Tax=Algoriphagus confluentis TaxID=1697556 RepID=A0ABQ6PMY6_9BACT|nr:hypothetical protein Aconfl_16540 [Algoriphagus confluentis]
MYIAIGFKGLLLDFGKFPLLKGARGFKSLKYVQHSE